MKLVAYSGPETGQRDRASYVLQQDKIRFVLTTPMQPDHPINDHIKRHGDGVRDIALWVDDAEFAYEETTKRGGKGVMEPTMSKDEFGEVKRSAIATYGDTIHSFVERKNYNGTFMPGFKPVESPDLVYRPVGLKYIDHMVGNVGWGQMNTWVKFYEDVMGFRMFKHFDDKDISTEYSALMSKVVANGNDRIKFPINEPAKGKRKSQIEEYVEFYHGPGVQHIAMTTDNIRDAVSKLQKQGVDFLMVPNTYYESVSDRVGKIDEPIDELGKLGVLVATDIH
jgi:4-hydroxyphenylpyruvate dioxygenase